MATSPFSNLFLNLRKHISNACGSIRYVNADLGQLDFFEERPSVSFPCVLIDIGDTKFEDIANNAQLGDGIISIRIGLTNYADTSSLAPEDVAERGCEYWEIEQEVHEQLQGWAKDNVGKITRISAVTEKRRDEYRVRALRYSFGMEDNTTIKNKRVSRPDASIH